MNRPPDTIVCIECGGTAHRITYLPDDEPIGQGFPVAYRCGDCMDRFDLVWEDEETGE